MIYVVEDDPGIRELECYALRQAGFEARGFEEGQSFLEAVRVQLPQLVLLDVMLPGEDGNRLLARLKQDSRTRRLPVIMVTARGEEMDKVQGLSGAVSSMAVRISPMKSSGSSSATSSRQPEAPARSQCRTTESCPRMMKSR